LTEAPNIRPLGDGALLIEFGDTIDAVIHDQVMAWDAALAENPPQGMLESVPAYASLMVAYDNALTDLEQLSSQIRTAAKLAQTAALSPAEHCIPVCYEGEGAPDLGAVAERLGMTSDDVVAQHLAGSYEVYMYGFAPGYAYLGGVPDAVQLPRKAEPVRGHKVGSVMIAGGQCLITTLPMPTGWWVIGHSPAVILDPDGPRPFLFQPGDRVHFERIEGE